MKKRLLKTLPFILIFILSLSSSVFAMEVRPQSEAERAAIADIIPDRIDLSTIPFVLGDGYIDVEIPIEAFATAIAPHNINTVTLNAGSLSANFNRGQRLAISAPARFTTTHLPIPSSARITGIDASFQVATDRWNGVSTHSIGINYWNPYTRQSRSIEMNSTNPTAINQHLTTTWLNNYDPWADWDVTLIARRDILGTDNGAFARINSLNVRIHFRMW